MTKEQLIRSASEAAAFNGHRLDWTEIDARRSHGKCRKCDAGAYVDTSPPPNGIDISGRAVAINCK